MFFVHRSLLGLGLLLLSLGLRPSLRSLRRRSWRVLAESEGPRFGGIQHAGVLVADTAASKAFYLEVFGFLDDTHLRPGSLPFDGAFVRCGSSQIHPMQLPNPDPTTGRPEHGGRDRHVALTVNDIDVIRERLAQRGMPFTMSKSGRRALFCRDLDGNAFEFIEDSDL